MELVCRVKRTTIVLPDLGKGKDRTEVTEVTYIVPGELAEDSALRMRTEFTEMMCAKFGPRTVIESLLTD